MLSANLSKADFTPDDIRKTDKRHGLGNERNTYQLAWCEMTT